MFERCKEAAVAPSPERLTVMGVDPYWIGIVASKLPTASGVNVTSTTQVLLPGTAVVLKLPAVPG